MLSEFGGLLWLVVGLAGLGAAAALLTCCLPIRSPIEFVLAAYVLAWTWLVVIAFALSPARLLSRGGLLAGIAAGLIGAVAVWVARGRPRPLPLGPALRATRLALQRPAVLVLAIAVALGAAYSVALALFTPVNEGDALAYHLARAAFWHQEHGLGYVANTVDVRLNGNPPNAEIGQLATMLLSGSDRYVALPQLAAYGALGLSVAGLARRLGLDVAEALFGALAFATLPIVVVQASGALNDLVVASFLAIAALFALRPGRAPLVLFALVLGLALGTKLTAVLALPMLAVVAALARRRREWVSVGVAGVAGVALGSIWYLVNLVETGELDGGLAEAFDQRVDLSASAVTVNALRFALDLVDMSGSAPPYDASFLLAAGALAVLGLWRLPRSTSLGVGLLAAGLLTALPYFAEDLVRFAQDEIVRTWAALGRPETAPFERGWNLNVEADTVLSWFGPLGVVLLVAGTVAVVARWARKRLPAEALGLALAPWVLLLTLMATIVWDPFRGRFLVFGIALAAATWGLLLRHPVFAGATAAMGTIALAFSLANYLGKPSGLDSLWPRSDEAPASLRSIWGDDRAEAQARLRPTENEEALLRFIEETVPTDAHVAVGARENDFLSPYFGQRLSRDVTLVSRDSGTVPAEADWLVLSPSSSAERCRASWRRELELEPGWRVERRIASDGCPGSP